MIGPVIEEMANEYEGKAVIGKVNVDLNPGVGYSIYVNAYCDDDTDINVYRAESSGVIQEIYFRSTGKQQ